MTIEYTLEIVGGPFDGHREFVWRYTEGVTIELPGTIWIGLCDGAGQCTSVRCRGRGHAAYWIEEERHRPPDAIAYGLVESHLLEGAQGFGVATYAIGGLRPLGVGWAEEELPNVGQEHPLVPAGALAELRARYERASRQWRRFVEREAQGPIALADFSTAWELPSR